MKILPFSSFGTPVIHSASLTGITVLNEGGFKQRVNLPGSMVMDGSGRITTKKNYRPCPGEIIKAAKQKKYLLTKRKLAAADIKAAPPRLKKEKKPASFTINKSEISHRIKGFVNQMPGEKMLYFWTVTFPLKTTDDTAFVLLNKWLTRLRNENLLQNYLWISERQGNGTIHFHIAINQRLNVQKANKYMRASIMHCINAGEINYCRITAKNYNGVDIAKDRTVVYFT